MKILKLILFILFYTSLQFGQSVSDSLVLYDSLTAGKSLITRLDKQLNTYNLNNILIFNQQFGNFNFGITEHFNSTLIKSVPKNIKDEQFLSINTEYKFFPFLSFGAQIHNKILSDNRKIGLSEASELNTNIFSRITPQRSISILPFFGYSNNRQIGENDFGFFYGTEGTVDNFNYSDIDIYSTFKFNNEDISPRKNTLRDLNLNLSNNFDEFFRNILSSSFIQSRKDFYFRADSLVAQEFNLVNNIQSRTETNFFLQDKFFYNNFSSRFSFDLTGRVLWRNIDRDTRYRSLNNLSSSIFDVDVEEFRLEFESTGNYKSSMFDGSIHFLYSERDEKHITKRFDESNIFYREERQRSFEERSRLESQKNNKAIRSSVSLTGNLKLTANDNLAFSLLHNKLTYDTPSEDNFDDRDELLSILRFSYKRKMNSFWDLFINLEGSLNHIVYIFSERSSNNNIQRIIRLGTGGNYKGSIITSKNLFEVSANYTVYDFESQPVSVNFRSFSFRQLSLQDSTIIKITKRLSINFFGYLKYSEQGEFRWSDFVERPTRDLEEIYLEPKVNFKYSSFLFGVGMRYLTLATFTFKNKLRLIESDYNSIGPLTEITIRMNERLYLRIFGWYEFIKYETNKNRNLANLNIQMNWEL